MLPPVPDTPALQRLLLIMARLRDPEFGCPWDLQQSYATIVPHTLAETIMVDYQAGRKVNLEVDLLARYLERLLLGDKAAEPKASGLTESFLAEHGYLKN